MCLNSGRMMRANLSVQTSAANWFWWLHEDIACSHDSQFILQQTNHLRRLLPRTIDSEKDRNPNIIMHAKSSL